MTEDAVRQGFDDFIDRMEDYVVEEVQPLNAVGIPPFIGNPAKRAMLPFVRRETDEVGGSFELKFGIVADCAAGDSVEDRLGDYLAADAFYSNFKGPEGKKRELASKLKDRLLEMSEAVEPIARSDRDRFWDAVVDAYDREDAHAALDGCFDYAETARKYENDAELTLELDVGPFSRTVDYTGEAVRVLEVSEKRLRDEVRHEVDAVYDAKDD
jgi:hypothetical protein